MRTRLALAVAAALAAGCGDLLSFDVESSGTTTIPGSPVPDVLGGLPGMSGFSSINVAQSSEFQNKDTRKDLISSVRVKRMTLRVTNPSSQPLSFLTRVAFFVEAPGLAPRRIARLEPVPPGVTTADLQLDDVDIAAYAKADSFSVTTEAEGQSPPQQTTLEARLVLAVSASLL
jgi:hypothetical protein